MGVSDSELEFAGRIRRSVGQSVVRSVGGLFDLQIRRVGFGGRARRSDSELAFGGRVRRSDSGEPDSEVGLRGQIPRSNSEVGLGGRFREGRIREGLTRRLVLEVQFGGRFRRSDSELVRLVDGFGRAGLGGLTEV